METVEIPPEFKVQWLNETLKFIKDDRLLVYKYPAWPMERVKYYYAMIAQRNSQVGLGFKSLYAPLWEAMQIYSLKYAFKATIIDLKDEQKGRLVLEKIPKESAEQDETDSEEDSKCTHQLTKQSEKLYLENRTMIDKISPAFLKTTLQSLLDFIKDEASASIIFKDLAPIEAKFIQNVQAIHDHKFLFYKIFSPACIDILKKITLSLNTHKNSFKLKVGNVKTNMKTAKREVTVIKEPSFGHPQPKKESKPKENRKESQVNNPPVQALRSPKGVSYVKPSVKSEIEKTCKTNGGISPAATKPIMDRLTATQKAGESKPGIPAATPISGEKNRIQPSLKKDNGKAPTVKAVTDRETNPVAKNEAQKEKETISTPKCNVVKEDKTPVRASQNDRIQPGLKKDNGKAPTVKAVTDRETNPAAKNEAQKEKETISTPKCNGMKEDKTPVRASQNDRIQPCLKKDNDKAPTVKAVTDRETNPAAKNEAQKEKETISTPKCNGMKGDKTPVRTSQNDRLGLNTKKLDAKVGTPVQSKRPLTRAEHNKMMIEAMSKPLESDKALRMMKQMGWEGGALGLRGDGITEPIMPALDLKPRRGLGASAVEPVEPQTKKEPSKLRVLFLEGVLEVLHRGMKMVHFGTPLNKKEVKFFTSAITDLNRRAKISTAEGERKTMEGILEKLTREPEKKIEFSFVNGASALCLQLIIKKNTPQMDEEETDMEYTFEDILAELEATENLAAKARHKLALKIYILLSILEYVKSDKKFMDLEYNCVSICQSDYKYVTSVCNSVNNKNYTFSARETEIMKDITRNLNNQYIIVHMSDTILTLSKNVDKLEANLANECKQPESKKKGKKKKLKGVGIVAGSQANNVVTANTAKITVNNRLQVQNSSANGKDVVNVVNKANVISKDLFADKNNTQIKIEANSEQSNRNYSHNLNNIDTNLIKTEKISNFTEPNVVEMIDLTDDRFKCVDIPIEQPSVRNISETSHLDCINVIEYKEYNIIKIVLTNVDMLTRLSTSIQGHIINDDNCKNRYIKCHGIQYGGLIYSSEGRWFRDILCKNFNVQCTNGKLDKFKMKVHVNSFLKVKDILKALEMNNDGLAASSWTLLEEEYGFFVVLIDCDSFKFIVNKHFSLFAGIDTALFTVLL